LHGCFERGRLHPQPIVKPDAPDDALTEPGDAQPFATQWCVFSVS